MNTQTLESEYERLSSLARQLATPQTECAALRQQIADAEAKHSSALQAWVTSSVAGADPGPMPTPDASIVALRNRLAELETADRANEQARQMLQDRLTETARELIAHRERQAFARLESLIDVVAKENAAIERLLAQAAIHVAKICGVHKFLEDEANRSGGSTSERGAEVYRLRARMGALHAAAANIPITDAQVHEVVRQLAERLQ